MVVRIGRGGGAVGRWGGVAAFEDEEVAGAPVDGYGHRRGRAGEGDGLEVGHAVAHGGGFDGDESEAEARQCPGEQGAFLGDSGSGGGGGLAQQGPGAG